MRDVRVLAALALVACGTQGTQGESDGATPADAEARADARRGDAAGVLGHHDAGMGADASPRADAMSAVEARGSVEASPDAGIADVTVLPDVATHDDASARDAGAPTPDAGAWGTPVDGGPLFSGPTVNGTVTVNRSMDAGAIGEGFAGFSFEKTHMTNGSFTGQNTAIINLFNLVGPTVLRIGADDVDNCMWDPTAAAGGGAPPYSHNIGTADVDDLAAMIAATSARVIYGVNFNSASPMNSAEEAAYATSKLGASIYGFEIGNEINRYGSWASLETKWNSFATAILAAVPGAHFIGPAAGGGDALSLTTPFAESEKNNSLILLTQHYYAGTANQNQPTSYYVDRLLTVDPDPPTSQDGLIGTLTTTNTAATSNSIPVGFRLGECNTFADHGQEGVSNALISALWSLDFMFTSAKYGAGGVNFHGGEAGMDGNTPFYYSPILETNGVVTAATPLFYGMLLFTLAGPGQSVVTTATAGDLDFTAYAIERTDGSTSVVLDNKDTTSEVLATVNVGAPVASASAIYLQGPGPASLTATSGITLAGAGITADGVWGRQAPYALSTSGDTFTVLVPPASAALVRIP
jgi:hypothetical protein